MRNILSLIITITGLVLGFMGGTAVGTVGTLVFFRLLVFFTQVSLPETGFVAGFWALGVGVIFGILGGIFGLILAIRFLRKRQ
jgi:hypothetical protein